MRNTYETISNHFQSGRSVFLSTDSAIEYAAQKTLEELNLPQNFSCSGKEPYFCCKIKYTPVCNDFAEIKHIILACNRAKGLQKEFYGIAALDITDYLGHETEEYFDVLLKFLYDKSSFWHILLCVTSHNERKKDKMYSQIVKTLRCAAVKEKCDRTKQALDIIEQVIKQSNISFEKSAESLCCKLFAKSDCDAHIFKNVLADIVSDTGKDSLCDECVFEYFEDQSNIYSQMFYEQILMERRKNRESIQV